MGKKNKLDEAEAKGHELAQLIERAARRDLKLKALTAEQEADKAKIRELLPEGVYPTISAGDGMLLKTEPFKVLDKDKAAKLYGKKVMELVVTPEAVRRALTPEQAADLYRITTTKLSFQVVKS